MRRMFSQKQIEKLVQEVANNEIINAFDNDAFTDALSDFIADFEVDVKQLGNGSEYVGFLVLDGDVEIIETTDANAGKVLGVGESGSPELLSISGGTKLYKHHLESISYTYQGGSPVNCEIILFSNEATPVNNNNTLLLLLRDKTISFGKSSMGSYDKSILCITSNYMVIVDGSNGSLSSLYLGDVDFVFDSESSSDNVDEL